MKELNVNLSDYPDSTIFTVIEETQKRLFLYNIPPSDRSAVAVKHKRDVAWREIAAQIGLNAEETLSIWKKLRATFIRYFRTDQAAKQAGRSYDPSHWAYFESMQFVVPYIECIADGWKGNLSGPKYKGSKSAASNVAKKALKRSKNILFRHRNGDGEGIMSSHLGFTYKVDIVRMIELVKQYPIIYKIPANPHNHGERANAWKTIGQELAVPPKALVAKWSYLRQQLILVQRNNAAGKWCWYPHMEFFRPFIIRRKSRQGNASGTNQTASGGGDMGHSSGYAFGEPPQLTARTDSSDDDFAPHIEPMVLPKMEVDSNTSRAATPPLQSSNGVSEWKSPGVKASRGFSEYHFGICTAEMLEEIPNRNRAKLKARILHVVANAISG